MIMVKENTDQRNTANLPEDHFSNHGKGSKQYRLALLSLTLQCQQGITRQTWFSNFNKGEQENIQSGAFRLHKAKIS